MTLLTSGRVKPNLPTLTCRYSNALKDSWRIEEGAGSHRIANG